MMDSFLINDKYKNIKFKVRLDKLFQNREYGQNVRMVLSRDFRG